MVWDMDKVRELVDGLRAPRSTVAESATAANSDSPGCDVAEPHEHLVRFFFPLPSYLPITDGHVVIQAYPGPDGDEMAPTAVVTVHQVEGDPDPRTRADFLAVEKVLQRLALGGSNDEDHGPQGLAPQQMTVVDVVTQVASPDRPAYSERPQDAGPREDALMRALSAARDVARAARLTGDPHVVLPSYERLPVMVLMAVAVAPVKDDIRVVPPAGEWEVTGVMVLEHTNIGGWEVKDEAGLARLTREGSHWFQSMRHGFPAAVAREHLIQAQRHLQIDGEYAQAVLAAATGAEVLCDAMLSALLWEEHKINGAKPDAPEAARLFAKPKYTHRVASGLMPRLKGNWNEGSPWVQWRHGGSRLRNRVIHTGYQPSRAEAVAVVEQVDALQLFLLDRLAARAATYPRVACMLLSTDGLQKRGAYAGQVKEFIETQADKEPWWMPDMSAWHARLIETASSLDE